jgi:hypothetical protein
VTPGKNPDRLPRLCLMLTNSLILGKNKEFLSEAGKQLTRFTEEKTSFTFTIKKSDILFFEDKNSYGTFTTYSVIIFIDLYRK